MIPQFQQLRSATPEASIFYTPIRNLPSQFSRQRPAAADAGLPGSRSPTADAGADAPRTASCTTSTCRPAAPAPARRAAQRRRLVSGAHQEQHQPAADAGRRPPAGPEGSGAHPAAVRRARAEARLYGTAGSSCRNGSRADPVQAFHDRRPGAGGLPRRSTRRCSQQLPTYFQHACRRPDWRCSWSRS